MEDEGNGKLFDSVILSVIPSEDLSVTEAASYGEIVNSSGGRHAPLRESDEYVDDLAQLTHIVSAHIDFPQYDAALKHGIHIVKPSWILGSVQMGKLAQTRQHSPDPSQFFQDIIVATANVPEGDEDAIIAGVIALGGRHSGPLTKLVTHIVTTDLDNDRCRLAEEKKLACMIVLPNWFDDCLKLGKRINERPYMFPNPEILRTNYPSKTNDVPSIHLQGATSASPSVAPLASLPATPSRARKTLNALMRKKIMLSEDLQLSDHLHSTFESLITCAGATLTSQVNEADIYIGKYRDGDAYVKASRTGKEVANLSWLYHVINRNKYTSPLSKLLHYPVPRDGLPGFENMRISVSNYTGDARIYIENLIKVCGADFTKTMRQDNTHLITAHRESEKCEAAQEWNINVVNHLWLEESYAKCAVQTLTNKRYSTFPIRTNLGEVAGQTSFDMKRVEQMFFSKSLESPQKPSVLLHSPEKPVRSSSKSMTTTPSRKTPRASAHFSQQHDVSLPAQEYDNVEPDVFPDQQTAKRQRGRPGKSTVAPQVGNEEKENESPSTTSSGRASKVKALSMLHKQASDIALYNKEMKRRGGVTHSRSRPSDSVDLSSPALMSKQRKKRKSDEATYDVTAEGSALSDGETQAESTRGPKKVKHDLISSNPPPIKYKMMVTGDDRWLTSTSKESQDRLKLRNLGIHLVQDPKDVDILVAPKLLRTRKFLSALACAPRVVHTHYLDSILAENQLVEEPPLLQDSENEDRFGFKLEAALARAKLNKRQLFRNWSIFITKNVPGTFETYKEIITLNGGVAMLYQGRTGLTLPKRRLRDGSGSDSESHHQSDDASDEHFDHVYLVSGTTEPEIKLWKIFREMARKQGLQARIVAKDWLLNAAMSQEIKWDENWAMDEPGSSKVGVVLV